VHADRAELVARAWTRAPEDDASGLLVYRPSDWAFPPSRAPRAEIDLRPGGELVHRAGPAPDDRMAADAGRWELDGDRLVLRVEGRPEQQFAIDAVDDQQLLLRPLP
jgi:hypothetical protein